MDNELFSLYYINLEKVYELRMILNNVIPEQRVMEKKIELEEIMEKLDEVVRKMEQEKLTLEESYQQLSEGMKLVKEGNRAIDRVEKKIQKLMENEDEADEQREA